MYSFHPHLMMIVILKRENIALLVILLEFSDGTNKYEVLGDLVDRVYWDFQKTFHILQERTLNNHGRRRKIVS